MELTTSLPFVVQLDDADSPADVIDAVALGGFVAGTHPAARSRRLERVRTDATLLPPGVEPCLTAHAPWGATCLALGEGWLLRTRRWRDATAELTVTATTDALAREVLDAAISDAIEPVPDDRSVDMGFWHRAPHAHKRVGRSVAVERWPEIRGNYASPVAAALDRLIALEPADLRGRLLLLHGPPGTGKTTLVRALSDAWRAWCRVEFVLDPDRLLNDLGYLMHVVLGGEDDDDEGAPRRWRLIVLEDCDELIRAEAKQGSGQALARLLNLTDGVVGQGLDVLVCITTNERLGLLHPAITRPGRCLAHLHVGALSREEASRWLGRPAPTTADRFTLAELFALRGDLERIEQTERAVRAGLYL